MHPVARDGKRHPYQRHSPKAPKTTHGAKSLILRTMIG